MSLHAILESIQRLVRKVTGNDSVEDIVSDVTSKIAKLHKVASRASQEGADQQEIVFQAERARDDALKVMGRAYVLADRFAEFVK